MYISSLAASGTNLFAGTGGGVYLSTNNAISWTKISTPFSSFECMTQIGANLFAGTSEGVFLSTNNGASWTAVDSGLPGILDIDSFASSGIDVFAGSWYNGVFLTTNNGTSWTAVNTGLTNTNVQSLAVSGTNLFAGTYSSSVFGGVRCRK